MNMKIEYLRNSPETEERKLSLKVYENSQVFIEISEWLLKVYVNALQPSLWTGKSKHEFVSIICYFCRIPFSPLFNGKNSGLSSFLSLQCVVVVLSTDKVHLQFKMVNFHTSQTFLNEPYPNSKATESE